MFGLDLKQLFKISKVTINRSEIINVNKWRTDYDEEVYDAFEHAFNDEIGIFVMDSYSHLQSEITELCNNIFPLISSTKYGATILFAMSFLYKTIGKSEDDLKQHIVKKIVDKVSKIYLPCTITFENGNMLITLVSTTEHIDEFKTYLSQDLDCHEFDNVFVPNLSQSEIDSYNISKLLMDK